METAIKELDAASDVSDVTKDWLKIRVVDALYREYPYSAEQLRSFAPLLERFTTETPTKMIPVASCRGDVLVPVFDYSGQARWVLQKLEERSAWEAWNARRRELPASSTTQEILRRFLPTLAAEHGQEPRLFNAGLLGLCQQDFVLPDLGSDAGTIIEVLEADPSILALLSSSTRMQLARELRALSLEHTGPLAAEVLAIANKDPLNVQARALVLKNLSTPALAPNAIALLAESPQPSDVEAAVRLLENQTSLENQRHGVLLLLRLNTPEARAALAANLDRLQDPALRRKAEQGLKEQAR